ncbi:hypothetical protein [Cryobacterium sp. GrIS_2_6]|uniref:hypothetical protein n=1 Tax=Cryobacterium sp. GrIS_2_6 TaxID=3162785 RepID=UPI002E0A319C|nr:hypothetical protein [Cryobacterium psychrotolerans]
MSTQTEFDKELETILNNFRWKIQTESYNTSTNTIEAEAKEAIKQVVDKYIIGKDVAVLDEIATGQSQTGVLLHNSIKREQRLTLWENK